MRAYRHKPSRSTCRPATRSSGAASSKTSNAPVKRLRVIVPLTAFLLFALPFGAFRSIARVLPVLAIVPFTLVGAAAGLALAGLP
jgi:Cu/Ag efflux pump CusA